MDSVFDEQILKNLREAIGLVDLAALLRELPQEIRCQHSALRSGWDARKLESVRVVAHGLKGCVGTLGAMSMSNLCRTLEAAAASHDAARVGELLQPLEAAARACIAESFSRAAAEEQTACRTAGVVGGR